MYCLIFLFCHNSEPPLNQQQMLHTKTSASLDVFHGMARHMRKHSVPVTSQIRPCASIQARLRWTVPRLAPVRVSAIGAETTGHSVSTARNAGGVLPESGAIMVSARADHAWMSSSCRIAVRHAISISALRRQSPAHLFITIGNGVDAIIFHRYLPHKSVNSIFRLRARISELKAKSHI